MASVLQLVIPLEGGLRRLLVEELYNAHHFGVSKTLELLYLRVWWPQMCLFVAEYIASYSVCA